MKKITILLLYVLGSMSALAQQGLKDANLEELKTRMTGSFSSELQSKTDSAFFDIRLHMVQIWMQRNDGFWLYVEQAMSSALSRPYRQRVYHVYQLNDTTILSKVYEMNDPVRFAGRWTTPHTFDVLNTDSLVDRKGCGIYLKKDSQGNFYGSTPGKECLSSLRGAAYATSEVVIEKERLVSWDRGWDKDGKQVWGAVKGGYQFRKEIDQ
jgi:hypothetical protein